MASHELKNPLTTLRLILDVAKLKFPQAEYPEFQHTLLKLEKQTLRLDSQITSLCDLNLLESKQFFISRKTSNLSAMIENLVISLREHYPKIEYHSYETVWGVWDSDQIEKVSYELIQHSIRNGLNKPINVVVSQKDGNAYLEIKDQGEGVDPKRISTFFKDFDESGVGLHLYLAYKIVKLHGGDISVKSIPNTKTTFTVVLPQVHKG